MLRRAARCESGDQGICGDLLERIRGRIRRGGGPGQRDLTLSVRTRECEGAVAEAVAAVAEHELTRSRVACVPAQQQAESVRRRCDDLHLVDQILREQRAVEQPP